VTDRLTGLAAASGAAVGPAWWLSSPSLEADAAAAEGGQRDPDHERKRLDAALQQSAAELEALAARTVQRVGEEEGAIFEAHAAFASDPEVVDAARAAVVDGASAERAAREAFDAVRTVLAASTSEYMAARASDLDDVRDRVLRKLAGDDEQVVDPDEPVVVLADELTPSQTAELDADLVRALVTRTGSPTSHAAILARSLGIPAVVSVAELDRVADGATVGVDGDDGTVVVEPSEADVATLRERAAAVADRRAGLAALQHEPGATADGVRVELAANVGGQSEVDAAVAVGAEGVGLLRTEFLYLDRADPPTVEEQQGAYGRVLAAFPGARVVVRTLDAGADKPLPFTSRTAEPNPALGLRGIRLSLRAPDVFADQLRAVLRATRDLGDGGARAAIMLPLVSVPAELDAAHRVLRDVAAEEAFDLAEVELGTMVEVPVAALRARVLAERCDFLSIGTNDLLQYLFAADRLVGEVAELGDLLDPAALALVRHVVAAGHDGGAWVGVCGEAAADPVTAAVLCGLGVDELSMNSGSIPEIKDLLRRHEHPSFRAAAEAALAADDAESARSAARTALGV